MRFPLLTLSVHESPFLIIGTVAVARTACRLNIGMHITSALATGHYPIHGKGFINQCRPAVNARALLPIAEFPKQPVFPVVPVMIVSTILATQPHFPHPFGDSMVLAPPFTSFAPKGNTAHNLVRLCTMQPLGFSIMPIRLGSA